MIEIGDRVMVNDRYPFPKCYPYRGVVVEQYDAGYNTVVFVDGRYISGLFRDEELTKV